MKLRNKETGEIIENACIGVFEHKSSGDCKRVDTEARSLEKVLEVWEDYKPAEPFFSEKIRKAIRAWWNIQDNPFKSASVYCTNNRKDKDGFYNYAIFGYIRNGENKIASDFQFRTKKFYEYNASKDYTKEELCGEDEQ